MSGQALEIRYCKHLLDLLSHEKEKLKKRSSLGEDVITELEEIRQQLANLQEKMVGMVEDVTFVKELRIVTNVECGNMTMNMQLCQHDTFIALKFAVAEIVNQHRRWNAQIYFEDLCQIEEKEALDDSFVVAGWGPDVMNLGVSRIGRRIALPWSETKGSQPPDRDYLLGQLELHLFRHQERSATRITDGPVRIRTMSISTTTTTAILPPAATMSPTASLTSTLTPSSSHSSLSSHPSCLGHPSSVSTPKFQTNYFGSSTRSNSVSISTDAFASSSVASPERREEVENGAESKRLGEWESLVQCLLLPFVSAPSSVARCKAKLKKVLHKLEVSNAAISECKLAEFRLPSLVAETPRLRMLSQDHELWLLALDWHAPSFLIGLHIKGKKLGVSFGLNMQISGMRVIGTMRLRAPAYQAEARAIQFESDPTIDFAVESEVTVGGTALPFRQAIENALLTQINKALHKQIRKRMMGQEWVSLFQVKKEMSAALSQWSMHAKAFKFDGSDDVELLTEALESTASAQKLLLATTEAMDAHMEQIKAHLRHRDATSSSSGPNSLNRDGRTRSMSTNNTLTRGKAMSINDADHLRERLSVAQSSIEGKDLGKSLSTLPSRLESLTIAQTLPRPPSLDESPPPLPPRPARAMTLR